MKNANENTLKALEAIIAIEKSFEKCPLILVIVSGEDSGKESTNCPNKICTCLKDSNRKTISVGTN